MLDVYCVVKGLLIESLWLAEKLNPELLGAVNCVLKPLFESPKGGNDWLIGLTWFAELPFRKLNGFCCCCIPLMPLGLLDWNGEGWVEPKLAVGCGIGRECPGVPGRRPPRGLASLGALWLDTVLKSRCWVRGLKLMITAIKGAR